jgi:hypothetical protein
VNLYEYVFDDPLGGTDPMGTQALPEQCEVGLLMRPGGRSRRPTSWAE